jgi:hypothetical protein
MGGKGEGILSWIVERLVEKLEGGWSELRIL